MQQTNSTSEIRSIPIVNPMKTQNIEHVADKGIIQLKTDKFNKIYAYEIKPYYELPQQHRLYIDNKPTLFIDFKELLKQKIANHVIR
jgi:hypothetical protein